MSLTEGPVPAGPSSRLGPDYRIRPRPPRWREGEAVDLDDFTCRLCWSVFDGPGELAAHEQDEEETLYVIADT